MGSCIAGRELVRFHASDLWITCALEFRGRWHEQWRPHHFTWLYFHDEAVSFAAGHRPCAECRRDAYNAYRSAWADALGGAEPSAKEINRRLHGERIVRGTHRRRLHELDWARPARRRVRSPRRRARARPRRRAHRVDTRRLRRSTDAGRSAGPPPSSRRPRPSPRSAPVIPFMSRTSRRLRPRAERVPNGCPKRGQSVGSSTWKRVSPGCDSRRSSPWSRTTMRCAMSSPRPVPWPTGFVVKKASKTRGCRSAGMPRPVVADLHADALALAGAVRSVMRPAGRPTRVDRVVDQVRPDLVQLGPRRLDGRQVGVEVADDLDAASPRSLCASSASVLSRPSWMSTVWRGAWSR